MTLYLDLNFRMMNFKRVIDWGLMFDEVAAERLYPHIRVFPWR